MKRFLLSASAALIAFSGFSQASKIANLSPEIANKKITVPMHLVVNQNPVAAQNQTASNNGQRNPLETEIGTTKYDLQSNSAIQGRILNHSDGTISAAWTFSSQNNWSTRGTGYNYFNGTSWGTAPTSEIETERTGWPSMMSTSNGREVIIAHSTASNILRQSDRSSIGSGTWSQANLTNLASQVWNRGASTGNTLHVVCMTTPAANGGSVYEGMDGAFLYNRSTNGGISWDIEDYQIPGTDSSYFDGFDGDSYAIDADGDNVAVVVGALGRGVQLFKSTNAGLSWTKTDVLLSDVWFVESETFVDTTLDDRLYGSDGNVAVLLDGNGDAHVWYGAMYYANTDVTDGLITYYPGTNSIEYWNEGHPGPYSLTLAGALDYNANGVLDITDWGQYRFAGLASQPHAGIAGDGCIYLSYSAVREDLSNGSQTYRHTYVIRSCDGGCSWSEPIDVTGVSNNAFSECVYSSIARRVDDDIHMLYMNDNEPGIAVSGDEDPVTTNKMIYLKEDVDRFDTTEFCPVAIYGDDELCLGSGGTADLVAVGCAATYSWSGPGSYSSSNQMVSVSDTGMYMCIFDTDCGTDTAFHYVAQYVGTGGPFVNVTATSQAICSGDTAILTANTNVGGLVYAWSTGSTDSAIVITGPGTYSVTVTDCNAGSTDTSIVISSPAPPTAVVAGDTAFCPGGSVTLSVLPVAGSSYNWSTGSTSTSITVATAGTYTVTVASCAGSANATIIVIEEGIPTATINAPSLTGCDGDVLTATASGGFNYAWSNGDSTDVLTISTPAQSGTYTVTVSNNCGDEDTEEVTLTIFDLPATPVITFSGGVYTSSQTGGGTHTWYVGGSPVNGVSGNTLNGAPGYFGQTIACTYTDANGCSSAISTSLLNVNEVEDFANINVYPNPSNGQFEVNFGSLVGEMNVEISNALGQVVMNRQVQVSANQIETIDLTSFDHGIYQISIEGDNGKFIESIVIE